MNLQLILKFNQNLVGVRQIDSFQVNDQNKANATNNRKKKTGFYLISIGFTILLCPNKKWFAIFQNGNIFSITTTTTTTT